MAQKKDNFSVQNFKYKPSVIHTLLKERGWNQKKLAKLAGVSEPTIGRLMKGDPVSPMSIPKIAEAFGVSVGLFYESEMFVYTLDDAPVCESTYHLRLSGSQLALGEGLSGDVLVEVGKWDDTAKSEASRVIYRLAGHRRAFVAVAAQLGDELLLFPAALIHNAHSDAPLADDDGEVLGWIRDIVSLESLFRR